MSDVIKSTCGLCYCGCGVLVHRNGDRITKVEGDLDSPVNRGKLCTKGLASLEYLYHRDRLKHPLQRTGKKGDGQWRQISWDQALNIVADELIKAREQNGPESIAYIQGAAKGLQDRYGERFANAFGICNFSTTGHVCFAPRAFASNITCGFNPICDYEHPPACIMVWGANLAETRIGEHEQTVAALNKGAKLIVIDPRRTDLAQVQQKVTQIAQCRCDYEIINDLARKLGLEDCFWPDTESFLDAILEPAGLTFKEFRKVSCISGKKMYRNDSGPRFKTPSGKVELYSPLLKKWRIDPLPSYHELPETPLSDPELAEKYPLIFTSYKPESYRHTAGRQITSLRDSHPMPTVTIHPKTAQQFDIQYGDWVYIETQRGRIKQKAALSADIDPRVIIADYGWWFPEKAPFQLYGWAESNINILTDDQPPFSREMGSTNLRGILCKIYKA